jgi:hypothetical protein
MVGPHSRSLDALLIGVRRNIEVDHSDDGWDYYGSLRRNYLEARMVIRPEFPPNCEGGGVTWTVSDELSLTLGTDCSIWYYIVAWNARTVRVETLPGQGFPEAHERMHVEGAHDRDVEGQFALSVDGEPPVTLMISGGKFVSTATEAEFDLSSLGGFAPALARLDERAEHLRTRVDGLLALESEWTSCVSDAVTIGTGGGCLVGLGAGLASGGTLLPKAVGVGCASGAAMGLINGLILC